MVEPDKTIDHNITRRMRFACQILKATNTYSEYLILLFFTVVMRTLVIVPFIHALPVLCRFAIQQGCALRKLQK